MIFGFLLRKKREAAGLSAYAVVKGANIDQSNYRQIEAGERSASLTVIQELAKLEALGASLEELLLWQDLERLGKDGIERLRRNTIALYWVDLESLPEATRKARKKQAG